MMMNHADVPAVLVRAEVVDADPFGCAIRYGPGVSGGGMGGGYFSVLR